MNDIVAFLWIVAGIGLSLAVPVAVKTFRKAGATADAASQGNRVVLWYREVLKPYIGYVFASLVLGLLVLAALKYAGGEINAWYEALIAGYLWDATIQKLKIG